MLVIPVLDLLNGVVVRGVAGRREEYQAVVSRLVEQPDPLAVARAFRSKLGLDTLYVADLDAILHQRPNQGVYLQLRQEGFKLQIDAGLRDVESAAGVIAAGADAAIVGLETWPGPVPLAELCQRLEPERVIFSLDLKSGRPLGDLAAWRSEDACEIASQAVDAGIVRLIILDLSTVGVGGGIGTFELCTRLREKFPHLQLWTGGGVRNAADLETLMAAGIDGVLVASALHDGRLTRRELERVVLG